MQYSTVGVILSTTDIDWTKQVDELSRAILAKELTHNGMGTEKNKVIYIDMILTETLLASKSDNVLRIHIENELDEFVVTGKCYLDLPIATIIVEVKKEAFEQGRAQLYMRLFTDYNKNANSNANIPLFGVITNCQQWIFVHYDGKSFTESLPYFIKSSTRKEGLVELFGALVFMFETQAKLCTPFVVEMKNRKREYSS